MNIATGSLKLANGGFGMASTSFHDVVCLFACLFDCLYCFVGLFCFVLLVCFVLFGFVLFVCFSVCLSVVLLCFVGLFCFVVFCLFVCLICSGDLFAQGIVIVSNV